ncbi:MAG: AAA family ATPase [Candidatus Methanomethylophilus sp.]|nr:AAA family ATPase [Methanomethylophilus sp.]
MEYDGMQYENTAGGLSLVKGTDRDFVDIPESVGELKVISIGQEAFKGFTQLRKVVIPASVETVCHNAFAYCSSLQSVTFSEGLREIANYAFLMCSSLEELVLPDSLKSAGIWSFGYCRALRHISIAPSTKLGVSCFTCTFLDENNNPLKQADVPGGIYEKEEGSNELIAVARREGEPAEIPVISMTQTFDPKNPVFSKYRPVMDTGVTFADIAGLEDVKEAIRELIITPFKRADLYRRFGMESGGGVLLYGPPGTGKTMLAQAIATEVDAAFFSVKGSDLISKYVGESEQNVKKLFKAARSLPVSVIFFDEFEVIGRARGNDLQPWSDKLLSELLAQMQGFEKNEGTLLVLAATNMPWTIDSALLRPGRFNRRIYVSLPDTEAREQIVRNCLDGLPVAPDFDYAKAAEITDGFNAADVTEFCNRLKLSAIKRSIDSDRDEVICMKDMENASSMKSSVNPLDLAKLDAFSKM